MSGAVIGAVTAWLGEHATYAAKGWRNAIYFKRGEPGVKDMVWRPPWRELGVLGLACGIVAPLVGLPWWSGGMVPAGLSILRASIAWMNALRVSLR
jgi:hypothetical protein